MENMRIYNKLRTPPPEALKEISAGRLKGKTDINPMWRIRTLTETFGVCGIGWYIDDVTISYEPSGNEIICVVEINLYIKMDGEWSKPIHGIGGNKILSQERNGAYADDDGMKKAYSDAIGTACKALGMAADVYWEKDPTKYDALPDTQAKPRTSTPVCTDCGAVIAPMRNGKGEIYMSAEDAAKRAKDKFGRVLCVSCANQALDRIAEKEAS